MGSTGKMIVDIRKIELKREAFCKKMRAEIEKKRNEFSKGVETYREKLRTSSRKD